jgi:GT2 family glycosyltransferase
MKLLVLILNYKGMHDTLECVRSLEKSTYASYKILIIDNKSPNDSVAFLKKNLPKTRLIETKENLGYAGGNNVGLKIALEEGFDAVLVLNNDTAVDPNCLTAFVETSKIYPNAVLGARLYQYDEPKRMQHFGGIWNSYRAKFTCVPEDLFDAKEEWNEVKELDFLTGTALFIPISILKKVGLFEESFFLYYEEIDWCTKVQNSGFSCLYCPEAKIWHKESASFENPRPPQMYFLTRNRLLYLKRNCSKANFLFLLTTQYFYRAVLLHIKTLAKSFQILCLSLFYPQGLTKKRKLSKLAYQASLCGLYDFFLKRFGNAPSWVYTSLE